MAACSFCGGSSGTEARAYHVGPRMLTACGICRRLLAERKGAEILEIKTSDLRRGIAEAVALACEIRPRHAEAGAILLDGIGLALRELVARMLGEDRAAAEQLCAAMAKEFQN